MRERVKLSVEDEWSLSCAAGLHVRQYREARGESEWICSAGVDLDHSNWGASQGPLVRLGGTILQLIFNLLFIIIIISIINSIIFHHVMYHFNL